MHACVMMPVASRRVSPAEPVDLESGLPPPPFETTRTASHVLRSRFGESCLCRHVVLCFMSCAIY